MITHRSAVGRSPDGSAWDVECSCGWTSSSWPTQAAAAQRMQHHRVEHETGKPMPELRDVSL